MPYKGNSPLHATCITLLSKCLPLQLISYHQFHPQTPHQPFSSALLPYHYHHYLNPGLLPHRCSDHTKYQSAVLGRSNNLSPSHTRFPRHLLSIFFCPDLEGLGCFCVSVSRQTLDISPFEHASQVQNDMVVASSCPCHLKYQMHLYDFDTSSETCHTSTYLHWCKLYHHI